MIAFEGSTILIDRNDFIAQALAESEALDKTA
jgi:hypothetical protein